MLTGIGRLVCAGAGATATCLLQAIRMVDQFMGPNIALQCAKSMLIDVARAVAVSDRTLLRRFGAAIGQTPQAHLQAVRLEAARALLEAGDMTVQSVAMQVGYSDASSFSRLFKQGVGLSPGSYRPRFHLPALA